MLREAAPMYIDNAGITAKVLMALPRARRRVETRRLLLLLGSALLGTVITLVLAGNQLVAFGTLVTGHLARWGAVPGRWLGATFTIATAAAAIAIAAAGWWGWSRAR